jgi:hypothetical protein
MKFSLPRQRWLCFVVFLVGAEALAWIVCGAWDTLRPRHKAVVSFEAQFGPELEVRKAVAASGARGWSLECPFEARVRMPFVPARYEFAAIAESPVEAAKLANQVVKTVKDSMENKYLKGMNDDLDKTRREAELLSQKGDFRLIRMLEETDALARRLRPSSQSGLVEIRSPAHAALAKKIRTFPNRWVQAVVVCLAVLMAMRARREPAPSVPPMARGLAVP